MRFNARVSITVDLDATDGLDPDIAAGIVREAIANKAGEFGKAIATALEASRFRVGNAGTAFASVAVEAVESA